MGLVHKITISFADTGKIGHPVGDTLALNSVYFHTHRALHRKVTKNVGITNRNQHICMLKVVCADSSLFLFPKNQEQFSKHLCPKNVYSITYASLPKKMHKVDGFRPAFITFAPDEK